MSAFSTTPPFVASSVLTTVSAFSSGAAELSALVTIEESPGPVVVAMALDRAYVSWAGTVMRSCLRSDPQTSLRFHVLHDGSLAEPDVENLRTLISGSKSTLAIHAIDRDQIDHLPRTADFDQIVWLRFLLPELLRTESRVLYLDSDVLVCGPLGDLWIVDLGDSPIAAVANVVEPGARGRLQQFGVNYPGGFFNSGVLLMDLDVMRREGCTEELLRYANDNRDALLWPDQDVLNAVFAGRWMSLHPRWNVQNSFWSWADWALDVFSAADLREAMTSPRIRHFEGPSLSKPWHYLCPLPGRMEYRAVLAETPWANRPLEDRTVATRLIRMLPRAWWTPTYKTLLRSRLRFSNRSSGAR